ncbi:hypothetical protein [Streptomyces sp. KR80]|uniref:hypothetical protein n=1 Tax=Streptomyces sp. KR80 TaxID=3457426 RepID=UPI003FD29F34
MEEEQEHDCDEEWLVVTRRGWGGSGLAAMAALCTMAALPGQAMADGPERLPTYRTAEGAERVEGAASSTDGPPLNPGTYTDTIKQGEEKYYSVNLDAKSSAFISAVAAPRPGTNVADYGDGLKVTLEDIHGTECDTGGDATFGGDGMAYPIADYASRMIGGTDTDCQTEGPYVFKVERKGDVASAPGAWPIEIHYMSEPGLKGAAPAEPGEGSWSSATPAPLTSPTKMQAKGGTGFNDAGSVGKGVWRDTIRPGETRFYRVPVDWGQQLNVSAQLPNSPNAEDPSTGFVPDALGLTAYNPARGLVKGDNFTSYDGEQESAGLFTAPADYGNRFSSTSGTNAMRFAGWYYLAVSLHPDMAQFFKDGADLTLRVDVKGDPQRGPDYRGDEVRAGFGVTTKDQDMADHGLTAEDAARSDRLQLVAVVSLGAGTVLLLGLGAWTLLARRRAPAAGAPVHTGQPRQPQPQPYQPHQPPHQMHQSPQQGRPEPQDQRYGPPGGW